MEIFYKVAKDSNTQWYFDGSGFTATQQQAVLLAPNVTITDFKLNWGHHDVEVENACIPYIARDIVV